MSNEPTFDVFVCPNLKVGLALQIICNSHHYPSVVLEAELNSGRRYFAFACMSHTNNGLSFARHMLPAAMAYAEADKLDQLQEDAKFTAALWGEPLFNMPLDEFDTWQNRLRTDGIESAKERGIKILASHPPATTPKLDIPSKPGVSDVDNAAAFFESIRVAQETRKTE